MQSQDPMDVLSLPDADNGQHGATSTGMVQLNPGSTGIVQQQPDSSSNEQQQTGPGAGREQQAEADGGQLEGHQPRGTFTYLDVFAGTSAFSEQAESRGGIPVGFIEVDESDHPLLDFHNPPWIAADYYGNHWRDQVYQPADVMVAWPMCKHLARNGLMRMQEDEVASQLWDTLEAAVFFNVYLVALENVPRLEWLDFEHGLLSRCISIFAQAGYELAAVWNISDADLGGCTWRTRPWILFEKTALTMRLQPLLQPASSLQPQEMIQHALPCDQVKHLEISGDLVKSPDGWKPGRFRFSWTHPLQLGTVVTSSKLHGDFCVVADSGGAVKIRSTNPRHPYVMYADRYGLQLSSTTTVVRSLNSPCHTLRSSPDEPGNCVWLDHRFCPPMLRRMHSHEVWAMQGRCQSKLRKMVELGYSDDQIVHKAGKAITGKMAAFMADALAVRVPQLRAAAAGCLSPLAEDFS